MGLKAEIFEQAEVLEHLLDTQMETVQRIAAAIRRAAPQYVFLAARGTSDNAGRYANYLWGAHNRLPIALSAPSLFTFYQSPPSLRGALVLGISQSGQSPDIVSVLTEGRRQGVPTLAITNTPGSPLAQAADFVVDIQAGAETAVAATKTYTSELMAIAMLSAALENNLEHFAALRNVPGWIRQVLELDSQLEQIAGRYRFMRQCVVLGRGYNYCTAFEWALKLKELTYVVAEPYSSADFLHGPIAMVEPGFPVLVVVPGGKVYADMLQMLRRLRSESSADLMVISDQEDVLRELAQVGVRLPSGIPEWLSPLVAIVAAQLFAYHVTRIKEFNTDAPRSIHKVTETH